MKNTNQTWIIKNNKGEIINRMSYNLGKEVRSIYYGKLKDIIQMITYKEWLQMATIEVLNKGDDKVKHKPITKAQIENMLKEEI